MQHLAHVAIFAYSYNTDANEKKICKKPLPMCGAPWMLFFSFYLFFFLFCPLNLAAPLSLSISCLLARSFLLINLRASQYSFSVSELVFRDSILTTSNFRHATEIRFYSECRCSDDDVCLCVCVCCAPFAYVYQPLFNVRFVDSYTHWIHRWWRRADEPEIIDQERESKRIKSMQALKKIKVRKKMWINFIMAYMKWMWTISCVIYPYNNGQVVVQSYRLKQTPNL